MRGKKGKGKRGSPALFPPRDNKRVRVCRLARESRGIRETNICRAYRARTSDFSYPLGSPRREKIACFVILRDTAAQCNEITRVHAMHAFIGRFPYYALGASELYSPSLERLDRDALDRVSFHLWVF